MFCLSGMMNILFCTSVPFSSSFPWLCSPACPHPSCPIGAKMEFSRYLVMIISSFYGFIIALTWVYWTLFSARFNFQFKSYRLICLFTPNVFDMLFECIKLCAIPGNKTFSNMYLFRSQTIKHCHWWRWLFKTSKGTGDFFVLGWNRIFKFQLSMILLLKHQAMLKRVWLCQFNFFFFQTSFLM